MKHSGSESRPSNSWLFTKTLFGIHELSISDGANGVIGMDDVALVQYSSAGHFLVMDESSEGQGGGSEVEGRFVKGYRVAV